MLGTAWRVDSGGARKKDISMKKTRRRILGAGAADGTDIFQRKCSRMLWCIPCRGWRDQPWTGGTKAEMPPGHTGKEAEWHQGCGKVSVGVIIVEKFFKMIWM